MQMTEALEWLYSTQFFGIKLGLEATTKLMEDAGISIPSPSELTIVHVAGTNGKGSTCAMIERLAREQGFTTGLFTSPHLVHFNERIRVNGRMIADEDLLSLINQAKNVASTWEHSPTFFELALVIALKHFLNTGVNFLILETGMGGRLDATNALRKNVAVLTPIGLDHQQYLGNTLTDIAGEKAAIISYQTPVISAKQEKEAQEVIEAQARKQESLLLWASVDDETPTPGLKGKHQRENAALALLTMESLGLAPAPNVAQDILSQVVWEGRFEQINYPPLVMDGAHNEQAMTTLIDTWKEVYPHQQASIVFAASADKHLVEMIDMLEEIVGEWHLTPCSSPRILPSIEMQDLLQKQTKRPIFIHNSLGDALEMAENSNYPVLVTGSLFLIGDLKAYLSSTQKRTTAQ